MVGNQMVAMQVVEADLEVLEANYVAAIDLEVALEAYRQKAAMQVA